MQQIQPLSRHEITRSAPIAPRLGGLASVLLMLLALLPLGLLPASAQPASAQDGTERRIALVVGNGAYPAGDLATPANDAGLIAQTLQAAGFDVIGARDLESDAMRQTFREFLEKATAGGANTVAFVYLAGHGVQFEGENYFVPTDAKIERDTDVPLHAIRLSDYLRPLGALPLKARFVVLDAARENPYAAYGDPLAGGLALVEPDSGSLVAFNAAPGTVAPEGAGPYGAYAQALAEMIREGGLAHDLVFERARLRVSEVTQGAYIPWNAGKVAPKFFFFERADDAPTPVVHVDYTVQSAKPIKAFEPEAAFVAAVDRDTLDGYTEFVDAFPAHDLARRARAIAAARREAIIWRRTCSADNQDAYWTYLERYPKGPHAWDARRRLRRLAVAIEPPITYTRIVYDVPPPPVEEYYYVERRVIYYSDPYYRFTVVPRVPIYFLPPRPPEFIVLAPPPPIYLSYAYVLPVPVYIPVAKWVKPHRAVLAPADNVIFKNIHAPVAHNLVATQPQGGTPALPGPGAPLQAGPGVSGPGHSGPGIGTLAAGAAAVGLAAVALKVALPAGVAKKAATIPPVPGGVVVTLPKVQPLTKTGLAPLPLPVPGKGALPTGPGTPPGKGGGTGPSGTAGTPAVITKLPDPAPKTGAGAATGAPQSAKTSAGTNVGQALTPNVPPIKPGTSTPPPGGKPQVAATTSQVDAGKAAREAARAAERKREEASEERNRREIARKSAEKARERTKEREQPKKEVAEKSKERAREREQPKKEKVEEKPRKAQSEPRARSNTSNSNSNSESKERSQRQAANRAAVERQTPKQTSATPRRAPEPVKEIKKGGR